MKARRRLRLLDSGTGRGAHGCVDGDSGKLAKLVGGRFGDLRVFRVEVGERLRAGS